ncbi:hypothetical protein KIN20_026729 [Parelaphostrongylus tenuis]|uniref:Uncharacterized protein n=1 Tax=Parelaphostrongylus tenuis TaxID=148309 RepID=A0AAD5QYE3_PARTN|nr:hypothetical protein KIN20_026729 [Parelaphostrongylus tenuis]
MNRVLEIESALHRLLAVDEANLVMNNDWNDIADDIIRKLNMIREQCCRPFSPISSECSPNTSSASPRPHELTPPPSTLSSTDSEISEPYPISCSSDISYQSATNAFNREIFSRCVQIVEAADKLRHIEIQMILLAHHSYVVMVNEADRTEDALKLATYWITFLERVQRGRPNTELLEILDMQVIAYENLMELDDTNREILAQNLLATLVKSYKISCFVNRHFHSRSLRRLERISEWLQNQEEGSNVDETKQLVQQGIDEANIDRIRYETETKLTIRKRFDPNYILCCEIFRLLTSPRRGSLP